MGDKAKPKPKCGSLKCGGAHKFVMLPTKYLAQLEPHVDISITKVIKGV